MNFWAYMLHCRDRTFYVGHTDDLAKRMGQHEQGSIPGYTSVRLPVKLVWSQEFATRGEARTAERQIKGWGQAKKLALIRGDWAAISSLAANKLKKEGASTGSAKPGWNAERFLHPHLDHLPEEAMSLQAFVRRQAEDLRFRFRLTGIIDQIASPPPAGPTRRDELWQHTCFEAFLGSKATPDYVEFNFSPSSEWAAYQFDRYRTEMQRPAIQPPRIRCERTRYALELSAVVRLSGPVDRLHLNLAAVIEEKSGAKSYWALAHPPDGPPDFHDPACFVLELPPA